MPDNLFGAPQPGSFFGLTFKNAALPGVQDIDPELLMRPPNPQLLPPPPDPYAGKGFGGQFLQQLKDDLTGGADRRQTEYENRVRSLAAENEATRLAYEKERLGYVGRQVNTGERAQTADEARDAAAAEERRLINDALAALPGPLQAPGRLNRNNVTVETAYSPEDLIAQELKVAEAKRQGANLAFGGPSWTRRSEGAATAPAQPPGLITGLTPMPTPGGGPMEPSFAPTAAPRRTLGPMTPIAPTFGPTAPGAPSFGAPSLVPRVMGQPTRPLSSGQMIGNIEGNPDAGALQREIALKTALVGPQGVETMGDIAKLQAVPKTPPISSTPEYQTQKEYNVVKNRIENLRKPISTLVERTERMKTTLNTGGMTADALLAPELLTIMAGGMGSGLRMSEAEIARIVHGRTFKEDLQAAWSKYTASPEKGFQITPQQRKDMHAMVNEVSKRAQDQFQMIQDADQALLSADSVQELRQIAVDLQRNMENINRPSGDGKFHAVDGNGVDRAFDTKEDADALKEAVRAAGGARPAPAGGRGTGAAPTPAGPGRGAGPGAVRF